jgi:hypothetical protein
MPICKGYTVWLNIYQNKTATYEPKRNGSCGSEWGILWKLHSEHFFQQRNTWNSLEYATPIQSSRDTWKRVTIYIYIYINMGVCSGISIFRWMWQFHFTLLLDCISMSMSIRREQCGMLPKRSIYLRQNRCMYVCMFQHNLSFSECDSFISLFYLIV